MRLAIDPAALPRWNIRPAPVREKPPELPPAVRVFVEATRPRERGSEQQQLRREYGAAERHVFEP